jgi:O-antigen/teichoic acid export membrane protein
VITSATKIVATHHRREFSGQPRKMIRRLSWGIADQGMSSLTNFAVGVYVVRTLSAAQFGAFSVAYVTYAFALNASRGLATDPLMVRFSAVDRSAWRRAVPNCTGTALFVGVAASCCVLSAAAVLGGALRLAFLALGLTLPGLLLQDSWRYSFFALGRGSQAFLNDTIWAVVLFPALVLLQVTGHANVFWFTLAWGVGATVGAVVGPLQARVMPRITGTREWLSRHRDLGVRYLAEGVSSAGAGQFRGYGIALMLGLAPLGYVQAATTLTGPITILYLGMVLVTIPEAARVLRRKPQRLPLFCVLVSAGLAGGALVWGAFLLVAVPRGFGALLIGHIWPKTYGLILPQTVFLIGQGAAGGAGVGLHALAAARRSLRTVLIGAALSAGLSIAGAAIGGAAGAIEGTATAAWILVLVVWWQLRAALRESRTTAAVTVLEPGQEVAPRPKPMLAITPITGERVVVGVTFGEIVADARHEAGMTIRQLSESTGIPEAIIRAIERTDRFRFDEDDAAICIRSIAKALGANPLLLLEEYHTDVAESMQVV